MVYGVNGNGNINPQTPIRKFANPKGIEKTNSQPVFTAATNNAEVKQIDRKDLDKLNQIDGKTIEFRTIADDTNEILASYGLKTKVTPAQVASVGDIVNQQALPALASAGEKATEARIANPDGPFAELFSAIA